VAKRLRAPLLHDTGFKPGDALQRVLADGRSVVFVVVDEKTERSGTMPVVEILAWVGRPGQAPPSRQEMEELPAWKVSRPHWREGVFEEQVCRRLVIARNKRRPDPHSLVTVIASGIQRPPPETRWREGIAWDFLDGFLRSRLDL
jgi:hypothetical protein